jgi:predicted nucleic acid-binding protein
VTALVVDASVVVKWLFPEPHSGAARRILAEDYELLAPDLLWPELGNVLWKRFRSGEISADEARDLLQDLRRFPISTFPSFGLLGAALDIATRFGRSVSDSLYLALAMRHACRLATSDRRLYQGLRKGPLAPALLWIEDAR